MKNLIFSFSLIFVLALCACKTSQSTEQANTEVNPAASGFDLQNSDPKAIEIADEVMEAMGGRPAWDATDHIRWTFFGRRTLLWSKNTGNVRIDIPGDEMTILLNVHTDKGRIMKAGVEMTDTDSLAKYLKRGKGIWINDSYWLVMPFKLKDSGVTLTYSGEGKTEEGVDADILELRFKEVGNTPQNKYLVYVEKESRLLTQWTFYRNADDEKPGFTTPWINYKQHGGILLSGDRGETPRGKRELTNIAVYESLPASAYESFDEIDFSKM